MPSFIECRTMSLTLDRPRRWSSHTSFVLVTVGAMVNLSGFWRLPHLIHTAGGSAFVAVYVACSVIIGVPLVAAQLLLVRGRNLDIPGVVAAVTRRFRLAAAWRGLANVMLVVLVGLLSIYAVVAAWSLAFAVRGLAGVLPRHSASAAAAYFAKFLSDSGRGWGWIVVLIAGLAVIAAVGLQRGVSSVARTLVAVVTLGLILVLVAAFIWDDPGPILASLVAFQPGELSWSTAIAALAQVVFGLGLGSGILLALGSYLPERAPVLRLAVGVVAGQVVVSLAAGAAVAFVVGSPSLARLDSLQQLFVLIPTHGGGRGIAAVVLVALAAAALTTAVAFFEPLVLYLERRLDCTRALASVITALVILVVSGVVLLSYGPLSVWPGVDRHWFSRMIWLIGGIFLPVGALWLAIVSIGAVEQRLDDPHLSPRKRLSLRVWLGLLRVPALLALLIVLAKTSGLLAWARVLWGAFL